MHKLMTSQIYGPGNVLADAASRNKREVIEGFCNQIKTTPVELPVQTAAVVVAQTLVHNLSALKNYRADAPDGNTSKSRKKVTGGGKSTLDSAPDIAPDCRAGWECVLGNNARESVSVGVSYFDQAPDVAISRVKSPMGFNTAQASANSPLDIDQAPDVTSGVSGVQSPTVKNNNTTKSNATYKPAFVFSDAMQGAASVTRMPVRALSSQLHSDLVDGITQSILNDSSPLAIKPPDLYEFQGTVKALFDLLQANVNYNTAKKDQYDWGWWSAMTSRLGTPALRTDVAANLGIDTIGHFREIIVQCLVLVQVHREMKPRTRVRQEAGMPAKPQSNYSVILSTKRVHSRYVIKMADSPMVKQVLSALLRQYVRDHGVDALMPERKEPSTVDEVLKLLQLPMDQQYASVKLLCQQAEFASRVSK